MSAPADARPANGAEREAVLAKLAIRFPDDPPACRSTSSIKVAQSKPRLAVVSSTSNRRREKLGCVVGDGFMVMRRPETGDSAFGIIRA